MLCLVDVILDIVQQADLSPCIPTRHSSVIISRAASKDPSRFRPHRNLKSQTSERILMKLGRTAMS